jgi:hypothetical protein
MSISSVLNPPNKLDNESQFSYDKSQQIIPSGHASLERQPPDRSLNHYRANRSPGQRLTHSILPNPHRVSKPAHSNKAYTREQVDWIRYHKDDLNFGWKSLPTKFLKQFSDRRDTDQCFSSRYYRDNEVPVHQNWVIQREGGKPVMRACNVRKRNKPDGVLDDIPFKLVEKHPERALTYKWVSAKDKERADNIIKRDKRLCDGTIASNPNESKPLSLPRRI